MYALYATPTARERLRIGLSQSAVAWPWVPHPELVPGGARMSGEVGGMHRAEAPRVSGGLSRLPEALRRWVGVYPHDD